MAALSPPFTGTDMKSLYNKVIRGVYPNIPNIYSQDLSNMIRAMLQVIPSSRPSCAQILENPGVIRHLNQASVEESDHSSNLLGTIKFVPGFKALKNKLPESNYQKKERVESARPIRDEIKEEVPFAKPRGISSAKGARPPIVVEEKKVEINRSPLQAKSPQNRINNNQIPLGQQNKIPQNVGYQPKVQPRPDSKNQPPQRAESNPKLIPRDQNRIQPKPDNKPNLQQKPPIPQPKNLSVQQVQISKIGVNEINTPRHRQDGAQNLNNQIKAQYDKAPINPILGGQPIRKYEVAKPTWWG